MSPGDLLSKAEIGLRKNYHPGIGLFASAGGHFDQEVWTRDLFISSFGILDDRVTETLQTILNHQRTDGLFPYRIELKNHILGFLFGWLKRFGVDIIKRKKPTPIYKKFFNHIPIDTIPSVIITFGRVYSWMSGKEAKLLLDKNFDKLAKAMTFLEQYADDKDGLIKGKAPQDWLDCIYREGKLSLVNILLARAYVEMAKLAHDYGVECDHYEQKAKLIFLNTKAKFLSKEGYFWSSQEDHRLDTVANIFYCLLFPDEELMVKIQKKIEDKAETPHGLLRAVDQPYPFSKISWDNKIWGVNKYGHIYYYPWITQLNLLAKIKMLNDFSFLDTKTRGIFLEKISKLFTELTKLNKDFPEMLDEKTLKPARHKILGISLFGSSPNFLEGIATYLGVAEFLNNLPEVVTKENKEILLSSVEY